ncbi:hypothetical protein GIB67_036797 [Kingdonia uniflora]|uniref:Peptidase M50 domain-containing protein n=1 Tax=Kingdonia uniflora TaxID=39325 RepID=A0A7J7LX04_9MAGN|nr:hypothetical protein GIB67_036797 [Kingdonia uniflora]
MNLATTSRQILIPMLQCSSCSSLLQFLPIPNISLVVRRKCYQRSDLQANSVSRLASRRIVVSRVADTSETEPDNSKDKENPVSEDGKTKPSTDSTMQDRHLDSKPAIIDATVDKNEDSMEMSILNSNGSAENNDEGSKSEDNVQGVNSSDVASGSPLPGLKQQGEPIRIPKETIDILKDQVFGFDTFFVTSQDPYEGGVLFKGNLRGKAAKSYEKITKRIELLSSLNQISYSQNKFGDQYKIFLLINPEDDKPVAVVVPRKTLQPETAAVPEWVAAGAFGAVTIFTLLLRNVPALQSNLLSSFDNLSLLKDGLAGAVVTALILGVHELGHVLVARNSGLKLGVPYFVPSWQIGSFGSITRIVNIVPNREDLLKFAAAGPLAGFSLGLVLFLLGFFIPPSDGIGVVVDSSVFHESFLIGGIGKDFIYKENRANDIILAKLLLGDVLKEGSPISLNPLVIWAWAGLLINAINSIPAGELDGGRISLSLWGRKASSRLTGASIALLGLSSLFNDVAFYWVVLIFFLQRGPIAPLAEEITDPDNKYVALGIAVLFLGLLVCLPYPFPFTSDIVMDL